MEKLKVYLDTSVISLLQQEDSPERMNATLELWKHFEAGKFDIYLSDVTLDEINKCPEPRQTALYDFLGRITYTELKVTNEVNRLANRIIELEILRPKSLNDSRHIAVALINGCDYILSWNFKHMVRPKTNIGIRGIAIIEGYKEIFILSPSSLLGEISL